MRTGDWVTTISKGYFQIQKIVRRYYDESHIGGMLDPQVHSIGDEMPNPIFVLKKGCTFAFKQMNGWEAVVESLCTKVDDATCGKIEELFQDETYRRKFEQYSIPPILNILNLTLQSNEEIVERLQELKKTIHEGLTYLEILQATNLNEHIQTLGNLKVQFINVDFEINVNKKMVFREVHLS